MVSAYSQREVIPVLHISDSVYLTTHGKSLSKCLYHTFKAAEASFKIHLEFLVTRLCLLKLCIRHGDFTGMSP